jgi:PAS domain S-box-containing protein
MDLDDILALAETRQPSPLEIVRARRVTRAVQGEFDRSVAEGYEILIDTDVVDPLTAQAKEWTRIERAARLTKRGTITWRRGVGRPAEALAWSDEMALIFGHAPGVLHHSPVDRLAELIHPADAATVRRTVESAWSQRRPEEVTFRVVHPGGAVRHVQCHIEILTTGGERSGIVATGEDVTAIELDRQERRRLATRDAMLCPDPAARDLATGMPTRRYLIDEADRARRVGAGSLVVVATAPAARLSTPVSDEEHDRIAADVAVMLRSVVDPDLVCGAVGPGRWGVVVGPPSDDHDPAGALALRIVETLRRHLFTARQRTLRLNAWAGVVHFARTGAVTGFDLLTDGDHAAGEARRAGTAVHVLDRPEPDGDRIARCRAAVRDAVVANRFALYAQPILDLDLNQVTRHEILLRVFGDSGDPIAPWAFLDMAERVGEIAAVDRWVIDHALELIGQGAQTSHYQINVSGRSLADPGLLAFVTEAVDRHRVDPDCLTFEITETALIENRNEALSFATGIRAIGCRLALDDFGTGYAALAFLKHLPVDLVKIDGVFVLDLRRSPADQAIVSRLAALCHALGIRVAAECVPDGETVAMLREYGVDFAQGHRLGRPVPIAASLKDPSNSIEMEIRLPDRRAALA